MLRSRAFLRCLLLCVRPFSGGSTSEYGLMVDTVNGITLDYNKDGMYWSFYINGEYAMTGVDATPVEADATYSFVATAA